MHLSILKQCTFDKEWQKYANTSDHDLFKATWELPQKDSRVTDRRAMGKFGIWGH